MYLHIHNYYVWCDSLYFISIEITVSVLPIRDSIINENDGLFRLELSLSNPSSFDETVEIRTSDDSAIGKP